MKERWKHILLPYHKEVIQKIGEPNMSLNIYSRWIGQFVGWALTFTSYESLEKHGFSEPVKTDEDLKNELVRFILEYK